MAEQKITTINNNFEKILRSAMEFPGVRINRAEFLRKSLSRHYSDDVVNKAINSNPAQAEVSVENIERIAKSNISGMIHAMNHAHYPGRGFLKPEKASHKYYIIAKITL